MFSYVRLILDAPSKTVCVGAIHNPRHIKPQTSQTPDTSNPRHFKPKTHETSDKEYRGVNYTKDKNTFIIC